MSRRLQYGDAADKDIEALFRYIADGSNDAIARKFVVSLTDRCKRLAALPGTLGTGRPDLAPGLRSTPHRGYVIYFRYGADEFEIVNVLDARRDVLTHFKGVPDSD